MTLEDIRKQIDELDSQIIALLDRRARAGRYAGDIKKQLGQPLHNPAREKEILQRLATKSDGSMPRSALENIYRVIMAETLGIEIRDGEKRGCMESKHDKQAKVDMRAEILENVELAPGFFRMRLCAPALAYAFLPGQFFQIRVGEDGLSFFLRRPFAPSEMLPDGFRFVYATVGEGTKAMSRLPSGACVDVLAPLGNSYTTPSSAASALLIGGGAGSPSLVPLARVLRHAGVHITVLIGARTSAVLLEQESFAKLADHLIVATDDGSCGYRGSTLDALRMDEKAKSRVYDQIYACGPIPMLRAVAELADALGVGCEVSLEERMACGFGACVGCAVPFLDEKADGDIVYRRVCHEGPVFDAKMLAWDLMR